MKDYDWQWEKGSAGTHYWLRDVAGRRRKETGGGGAIGVLDTAEKGWRVSTWWYPRPAGLGHSTFLTHLPRELSLEEAQATAKTLILAGAEL